MSESTDRTRETEVIQLEAKKVLRAFKTDTNFKKTSFLQVSCSDMSLRYILRGDGDGNRLAAVVRHHHG